MAVGVSFLAATAVAVFVLARGRGLGRWRWLEWLAWATIIGVHIAVAVEYLQDVTGGLAERRVLGIDATEAVVSLLVCTLALLVATLCVVAARRLGSAPGPRSTTALRGLTSLLVVASLAAGGGVVAAATAAAVGLDCRAFRIDPAAWRATRIESEEPGQQTTRERMADTIVRCKTLDGLPRSDVRRLLGREGGNRRSWRYMVGPVNDVAGPGDSQDLIVSFSKVGRVTNARLE